MLGMYTVPSGEDTKKSGYGGIKGSSSAGKASGLQSDFASECLSLIDDLKSAGCAVAIGSYGFMTIDDADKMSETGNKSYRANIGYYQFGLALDITLESSRANVKDSDVKYSGDDAVSHIAESHGLKVSQKTLTGDGVIQSAIAKAGMFVIPANMKTSADVNDVSYDVSKTGSTSANGTNSTSGASVASVAYFFSNQYSSYAAEMQSELLSGNRALANDTTVMSYVKSAAESSLRTFASGPNGEFMAWYPDYWGMYGNKTPYLELDSIELIDLTIEQNESNFYSHVYCPGVTAGGASMDYRNTQGVVSIESDTTALASAASGITGDSSDYVVSDEVSAVLKNLIYIPEGEEWRYTPKELYRRYGARPYQSREARTLIEEPDAITFENNPKYILPFLKALSEFMKKWAEQNTCSLRITFMPELFPGCRIKLKDFDVSMYVKSVSHNMDYQGGFTTTVTCTCPVGTLVRGMVNPNLGMGKSDGNKSNSGVAAVSKVNRAASVVRSFIGGN